LAEAEPLGQEVGGSAKGVAGAHDGDDCRGRAAGSSTPRYIVGQWAVATASPAG
jgi:hypothetical protein